MKIKTSREMKVDPSDARKGTPAGKTVIQKIKERDNKKRRTADRKIAVQKAGIKKRQEDKMAALRERSLVVRKQKLALEELYDGSTALESIKEEIFVASILIGLSKRDSAIKAGYNKKQPSGYANELLRRDRVQKRLAYRRRQLSTWFDVEAKKNLQAMACIAYSDVNEFFDKEGNIRPIHEIPRHARMAISGFDIDEIYEGVGKNRKFVGVTKKIRLADRNKAQESIARVQGQFEKDDGGKGGPVQHLVINFNDIKVANITDDRDREHNSSECTVSA